MTTPILTIEMGDDAHTVRLSIFSAKIDETGMTFVMADHRGAGIWKMTFRPGDDMTEVSAAIINFIKGPLLEGRFENITMDDIVPYIAPPPIGF